MEHLDRKIVKDLKDDIEDSIFHNEIGEFIDSLADLETDKDIFDKCLGGKENE